MAYFDKEECLCCPV